MSTPEKKAENVISKYNLYLDKGKKNFIQIDIDINSTCDSILVQNKVSLVEVIQSIYKKNIEDCNFLIIENKINKKNEDIPTLMEFRINKRTKIYNLLQNPQNNLYFLPKQKSTRETRLKARNEFIVPENRFDLAETNYFLPKNNEEYLTKAVIYLYNPVKQSFTKEKGSVDKQKIMIYKSSTNKEIIEILIKDIVKNLYYTDTTQAPYKKNLPIKGDKPKFYIEIVTNKITCYLGQFKESLNAQWEKAIKKSIIKYNNFNYDLNLNIKINSSKTSLFAVHHSIIDNCFRIQKILFNEEKRKMFLSISREKKICSIIINILTYKDLIKKCDYLEAWMRFKEIQTYIDSYEAQVQSPNPKNEKIAKIFSKDIINNYRKVSDASNESVKKINMVNASLPLFQIEMQKALSDILKEDLFDAIFISLYKIYIIPFFQDIKKSLLKGAHPLEKPLIRQKFQFLLAISFNNIFNTSADNFDDLYLNMLNQNGLLKTETLTNEISNLVK